MIWQIAKKIEPNTREKLAKFSPIISQLLFNREISSEEEAQLFFTSYPFGDFHKFDSMTRAVDRIKKAIDNNEKILLHGDYDVDGITSTALLYDYLKNYHNANVTAFIPNRFSDGYGVKENNIKRFINEGYTLIITIDCGIREVELLEKFKDEKIDFIITDHHTPSDTLPRPHALIHPLLGYTFPHLSGAAVAWKLLCAIEELFPKGVDPEEFLDIVVLGVVCDQMPIIDENRTIVKKGLEKLRYTKRIGLIELMNEAQIPFVALNTYHIGFVIGPRLNAGGRLDTAMDGFHLLVTQDKSEAEKLAKKLSSLNSQRQEFTKKVTDEALSITKDDLNSKILIAQGEDWPEGVIGIAAGKVFEITGKPTIVLTKKHGKYVGSCRSSEQVNIVELLTNTKDLLYSYGGHAAAAGLTIEEGNIEEFKKRVNDITQSYEADEKKLSLEMELDFSDISWETLKDIDQFSPFGNKNPSPLFVLKDMMIIQISAIGENGKHLRMKLTPANNTSQPAFGAIAFNMGKLINNLSFGSIIDIAFSMEDNVWNNNHYLQLNIKDIHFK